MQIAAQGHSEFVSVEFNKHAVQVATRDMSIVPFSVAGGQVQASSMEGEKVFAARVWEAKRKRLNDNDRNAMRIKII